MVRHFPYRLGDLGAAAPAGPVTPLAKPERTQRIPAGPDPWTLSQLIDEVVPLSRKLRSALELPGGEEPLLNERRDLLRELERVGPQTVPQLARSRAVTRQHVQALVNELESLGHVEFIDNPAHRRSRLVRLTSSGADLLLEARRREAVWLSGLQVGASTRDVEIAAEVLRLLGVALAAGQ